MASRPRSRPQRRRRPRHPELPPRAQSVQQLPLGLLVGGVPMGGQDRDVGATLDGEGNIAGRGNNPPLLPLRNDTREKEKEKKILSKGSVDQLRTRITERTPD